MMNEISNMRNPVPASGPFSVFSKKTEMLLKNSPPTPNTTSNFTACPMRTLRARAENKSEMSVRHKYGIGVKSSYKKILK